MDVYKACGYSEARQGVGKQIVAAAVNRLLSNDVAAVLSESLESVINSRSARSSCKSRNAALKSSYSLFKNILSAVCQSAVNVARILQAESCRRMGTVMENIGGCCINRNGS